jgi:hypothetical protein
MMPLLIVYWGKKTFPLQGLRIKSFLPPNPHLSPFGDKQKFLAVGEGKYIQPNDSENEELILHFRGCYSSILLSFAFPQLLKFLEKGVWGKNFFLKKFFPQKFITP